MCKINICKLRSYASHTLQKRHSRENRIDEEWGQHPNLFPRGHLLSHYKHMDFLKIYQITNTEQLQHLQSQQKHA